MDQLKRKVMNVENAWDSARGWRKILHTMMMVQRFVDQDSRVQGQSRLIVRPEKLY